MYSSSRRAHCETSRESRTTKKLLSRAKPSIAVPSRRERSLAAAMISQGVQGELRQRRSRGRTQPLRRLRKASRSAELRPGWREYAFDVVTIG